MKRSFLTLMAALALVGAHAAPARKALTHYTQPDGSVITVRLCGDEFHHFYTTEDGTPIMLCEDGFYRYTTLDGHSNLVPSSIKVGEPLSAEIAPKEHVTLQHKNMHQSRRNSRTVGVQTRRAPMRHAARKTTQEDTPVKGIILLVEFQDKAFKIPQSNVNDMINKEGYSDKYGSIGSARDYYIAQSYGKFKPEFDVVGPIKLSQNMSYYGANDRYGNDAHPDVMVSEACEIASQNGLVNMSDYDSDKDGWVDLVYVIYAGYSENNPGVDSNTIWPHAWYIYQGAKREVTLDGVKLDAYACSAELNGNSGTSPDGVGTFCHEFSHTLGLPDWYDIDNSGGMGMDIWSVMDYGCYAGDGYVPINFNAYERAFCGWMELQELAEPTSVTMPELGSSENSAYKITSTDPNQYITLESRRKYGWDSGLPAEGMMVVAVDYDEKAWAMNGPNDSPSRQRFKLIPADNRWSTYDLEGDLFPFNGNNQLTEATSPKMKVYNTIIQGKPITDIAFSEGTTTFEFMGGDGARIKAPVATSAGQISETEFTAYWSKVDNAISYTLYVDRIEEIEAPSVALEENFDKFTANNSEDISSTLDEYTMTSGWSGSNVFCSNGMLKLGSSKYPGSITTPSFNSDAEFTLSFTTSAYNVSAEAGTLVVTISGATEKVCEIDMALLPAGGNKEVQIALDNGGEGVVITLEANRRIFIDNLMITNGINNYDNIGTPVIDDKKEVIESVNIVESRIIENITNTYYTVDMVESPVQVGKYRYKVKAVTEMGESEWSNEINVSTDLSGVEEVVTSAKVFSANGIIYMQGNNSATIYNMQGVVVATITLGNEIASYAPATSGIYLVRCGNSVSKVVVRK